MSWNFSKCFSLTLVKKRQKQHLLRVITGNGQLVYIKTAAQTRLGRRVKVVTLLHLHFIRLFGSFKFFMQAVDLLQFGFIENLEVYRIYMVNRARSFVKYLTTVNFWCVR